MFSKKTTTAPASLLFNFLFMTISYRLIPTLLEKEEQKKTSLRESSIQTEGCIPDTSTLYEEPSFYLVRQRIENLREQIDKSVEEVLELEELQISYKQELEDLKAISENLGKPSKIDTFKAALEGVRTNRTDDTKYDGGEDDNEYFSNVDQAYITLFEESWLNTKSFRFLDNSYKVIVQDKKTLSIFDVFDVSEIGNIFCRCSDLARSPIYEGRKVVGEDVYALAYGIQIKFKDKSAKFSVPMDQFKDIPKVTIDVPKYLEFTMVLPEYAHEKKRYFQKGAMVEEFAKYLEKLDVPLSDAQREYLNNLSKQGFLRLYREVLENKREFMIRAYFLNITSVTMKQKTDFLEKLGKFLRTSETVTVTRALPNKNLPEWMKKIDGIIVEHIHGEFITFAKPRKVSVDSNLNIQAYQEKLFLPSKTLAESNLDVSKWQESFLYELRKRYKHNVQKFQVYAKDVMRGKIELVCRCEHGKHLERCGVPVLGQVFQKILDNK